MAQQSFIQTLVSIDSAAYAQATQSPFLEAAARGELPKDVLGRWLANDRLYIHAYIRGIGRLVSFLQLPAQAAEADEASAAKFLGWAVDALVNLRQEEKFFINTAAEYGLKIDLATADAKLLGLRRFEATFGDIHDGGHIIMPWLEAAIIFYATEKCYLDAWSQTKAQMDAHGGSGQDADGGALRDKFIPQWSNAEFADFVNRLGGIIDEAIEKEIKLHGEGIRSTLLQRATVIWHEVLTAEKAFWPEI